MDDFFFFEPFKIRSVYATISKATRLQKKFILIVPDHLQERLQAQQSLLDPPLCRSEHEFDRQERAIAFSSPGTFSCLFNAISKLMSGKVTYNSYTKFLGKHQQNTPLYDTLHVLRAKK